MVDYRKKGRCFGKINSGRLECCRENGCFLLLSLLVTGGLAFFFYRSVWAVIPLSGIGVAFFLKLRKENEKRKKQELTVQFKECILAVATLLQAGYSAENAFVESRKDMVMLFGNKARICRELRLLQRGLHINITLEELLSDMAKRTECEEIRQFAGVFGMAKRNGGSLPDIIFNTAQLTGRRIELRQELETCLSGRKMELMIMRFMPFFILCYVELTNPGYFQSLYHNGLGILVMTGCLGIYLLAYVMGERVLNQLWEEIS